MELARFLLLLLAGLWLLLLTCSADCDYPLLDSAVVSATSDASRDRGADKARLNSLVAWTAGQSDFGQYLIMDLGETKNISSIATQGRPFSSEFVLEYRVEFGNNGNDYAEYKDAEGNIKLFRGNVDGNNIQRNYFETPIIAQWVRINPTRWRDRISMRMELYGCSYMAETISFDGTSYITKMLRDRPIMSMRDHIRLRFRTNQADGILLYSHGTQGDVLALQLLDNQLLLNIDLGAKLLTSISVGSLLDDNLWHDVTIKRNLLDLVFTVDRVIVKRPIRGDFTQLDLNRELYVGGVPNFNQEGLVVADNFTGCIENLFVNYANFIEEFKSGDGYQFSLSRASILYSCPQEQVVPVTFKTSEAHLKLKGYDLVPNMNVSFDFRTFDDRGMLLYHKFSSIGYVQLYLEKGRIIVSLQAEEIPKVNIDSFDAIFNDGQWHRAMLIMAPNYVEVNVDDQPSRTERIISMKTGSHYFLGGGAYDYPGFVGCMRYINIDGNRIHPQNIPVANIMGDVMFDACQMVDRCNPNPCEHGGICHQTWQTFTCECTNSGYDGAVCHTSQYALSCEAYQNMDMHSKMADILVDVDGSGMLEPFPVTCEFLTGSRALTHLGHKNEKTTTVNGFEKAGSFVQDIAYNAIMDQMVELVNRSVSCKQYLQYECFGARLFNSPVSENAAFKPLSWWVSRTNQMMDYWGGSLPGSRKCECGLHDNCADKNRWCNCDSAQRTWLMDAGFLTNKEFLPVRQLRFGDTGSPMDDKQGRYSLGKLICEGDTLFDNTITFRLADSTVNLPPFDWGHSADIYFQFKTTVEDGTILHSRGPMDYIKVELLGGDQIQFSYYAGNGMYSVSVETSFKLNDDRWHSVLVERNRKEARLVVDGSLRRHISERTGSIRAIHLTSELVIGATVDYQEGFVGCIRAFMLNGEAVDLRGPAERGLYGVLPGCVGKCLSSPCLNNGTCWEYYSHYACDCRFTAFKGPICADEIGVNLRSDDMIVYTFDKPFYKSTIEEKIRVGFTTADQKGMLMGVIGVTGEYLNILLSTDGNLKIVFDFGFERQEVIYQDKNLANGQSHDVRVWRSNNGLTLNVKVDNYQHQHWNFKVEGSQDAQFNNLKTMYIGRNDSMGKDSTTAKREGFVGCISRVEFDDIYPLKLLYQEEKPDSIKAVPDTIREDFCGVEPITYQPEVTETRPPAYVDPSDNRYTGDGPQPADSAVLGGVLAIIFVALVIMAILIGRYVSRHKGEYRTHEDTGAHDAPDADTAISHGQTGHDVSKKKEWFI